MNKHEPTRIHPSGRCGPRREPFYLGRGETQHPLADDRPATWRLPRRGRPSGGPHTEPGPHSERGRQVPACLLEHAELHACPGMPSHRPVAVAPRHARVRQGRAAIPARDAEDAVRVRLLHLRHRQEPLPSATQSARLREGAAGRVRPLGIRRLPERLPFLVLEPGPESGPGTRPASAGTTARPGSTSCPSAFIRPRGRGTRQCGSSRPARPTGRSS